MTEVEGKGRSGWGLPKMTLIDMGVGAKVTYLIGTRVTKNDAM